jgi:hypothetical protein
MCAFIKEGKKTSCVFFYVRHKHIRTEHHHLYLYYTATSSFVRPAILVGTLLSEVFIPYTLLQLQLLCSWCRFAQEYWWYVHIWSISSYGPMNNECRLLSSTHVRIMFTLWQKLYKNWSFTCIDRVALSRISRNHHL